MPEVVRPNEAPVGGWWDEAAWRAFLDGWSAEVLSLLAAKAPAELTDREREALARGTLAEPGAPVGAIAALEARLNATLPPSYKAFLRVSGGWDRIGQDVVDGRLWPPERVRPFREQDPDWVAVWDALDDPEAGDDDYFVYGDAQDPVHLRAAYVGSAVAVSESIEASVYLLNPRVRSENGEWEAWFFANWLPGAQRYRSFQELMAAERARILDELARR